MDRKDFLKTLSVLPAVVFLPQGGGGEHIAQSKPEPSKWVRLKPGLQKVIRQHKEDPELWTLEAYRWGTDTVERATPIYDSALLQAASEGNVELLRIAGPVTINRGRHIQSRR